MDEHSTGLVVALQNLTTPTIANASNPTQADSQGIIFIVIIAILIFLSAFFSATETAYSSLSRARLKNMAQDGDKKAKLAYKLSDKYDELLSTILIGNNIVNIASATLATLFCVMYWQEHGATISTIATTIIVLIFGEITPKSLAKQNPEKFAVSVAPILKVLTVVFKPLNFLLLHLKGLITKMMKTEESSGITEDELLNLVDEAEQGGEINEEESELIKNAIEFTEVEAIDIFTPRIDVVGVNIDYNIEKVAEKFRETGFSRLPVYKETIDNIIGIINEKDFHNLIMGNKSSIETIIKPAEFIPPTMKISELLKVLQRRKLHFAIIVDEFGGTEGIVTMEDILEELVGEIWDEHDEVTDVIKDLGDGKFIVPTDNDLDEFIEMFQITQETESSTINGWIVEHLDKVPAIGDNFDLDNLTITVSKAESQRANEITVKINFEKVINEDDQL